MPNPDSKYEFYGNRTKMTERGEVTSYAFDSGDRLRQITNHKGEVFAFNYDNKNRITEIQRPGSNTVFDFYENDMLKTISHSNLNEVISLFDYVTNNLGNITSITTKKGTHLFGYDQNNQLTSSSNPEIAINELYSYDSLGNRIADQTGNYIYNESKQKLTEDPKHIFVYDLRGNLIQKTEKQSGRVHKYGYNSEDKLVKFELFDLGNNLIKEASYTYDVLGRRVEKVSKDYTNNTTKTRRFAYDGQEVLLGLDEDNNVLSKFTHSTLRTDDVLSVDVTDLGEQKGYAVKGSYQYLKNHLGSVVDVTDNTGNIVQHFVYSVFGEIKKITDKNGNEISNPVIEHHFAYTGREFDEESSLYYYRARHYDPQVGRFNQRDSDPGSLIKPSTFSSNYIYALNSPLRYTDPSGKCEILCAMVIGAVIGGIMSEFNHYSLFEGMLIGATAGAVGFSVGLEFAGGTFGEVLGGSLLSVGMGGLSGAGMGLAIALVGQDEEDFKNMEESLAIGLVAGGATGILVSTNLDQYLMGMLYSKLTPTALGLGATKLIANETCKSGEIFSFSAGGKCIPKNDSTFYEEVF